jgi:hypothetical protein
MDVSFLFLAVATLFSAYVVQIFNSTDCAGTANQVLNLKSNGSCTATKGFPLSTKYQSDVECTLTLFGDGLCVVETKAEARTQNSCFGPGFVIGGVSCK